MIRLRAKRNRICKQPEMNRWINISTQRQRERQSVGHKRANRVFFIDQKTCWCRRISKQWGKTRRSTQKVFYALKRKEEEKIVENKGKRAQNSIEVKKFSCWQSYFSLEHFVTTTRQCLRRVSEWWRERGRERAGDSWWWFRLQANVQNYTVTVAALYVLNLSANFSVKSNFTTLIKGKKLNTR